MASRLATTNTLLLVYLEGLIQDLESKSSANLLPVVDMVIQGANSRARVLGNLWAQLTIAQWHVWLNQSRLADADRVTVVKDAINPGEVFRPTVEATLDKAQKGRLDTVHPPVQRVEACGSETSEKAWASPAASFHRTGLLLEFWTCDTGISPAAAAGPTKVQPPLSIAPFVHG